MTLTPEDLERRKTVWDAMSDLFLDTETRWAIPRVALVVAQSGYATEEEIEAIWEREIVPECAGRLTRSGGAWELFVLDEASLALCAEGEHPSADAAGESPELGRVRMRWSAVRVLRSLLVELPVEDQAPRAAVWTAFVHVYLERSLETMESLEVQVDALRAGGAAEADLVARFDEIRPTMRALLAPDELADEQRRAIDVRVVIGLATNP